MFEQSRVACFIRRHLSKRPVQVVHAASQGQKLYTVPEVAVLEKEMERAKNEVLEQVRKAAQQQLEAQERDVRLAQARLEASKSSPAPADGSALDDLFAASAERCEGLEADAEPDAAALACEAAAKRDAAAKEARLKGMMEWDKVTRGSDPKKVREAGFRYHVSMCWVKRMTPRSTPNSKLHSHRNLSLLPAGVGHSPVSTMNREPDRFLHGVSCFAFPGLIRLLFNAAKRCC